MPFGLVTAPTTFSRLMRNLLRGMENIDNFIDDVVVFTPSFSHHVSVLTESFTRIAIRESNRKTIKVYYWLPDN